MLTEQIWTNNHWRNFNYLVACPVTGDALVIDPCDPQLCIDTAECHGWTIKQIVNTHEHGDHISGNATMVASTGAILMAHCNAPDKIEGVDVALEAGDLIPVGSSVHLEVLDTPGHTMSHICLLSKTLTPTLFCGDTLFSAGAGNCHGGGHPDHLYDTFTKQLAPLPDETLIYPGHDYIVNNLKFTLNIEPSNESAKQLLQQVEHQDVNHRLVTTIGLEKKINCFFRLHSPEVIHHIETTVPDFPHHPNSREVFLALRELRNRW